MKLCKQTKRILNTSFIPCSGYTCAKMFQKAGEAGWKSLIPLYNTYILFQISWGNGWLFLLGIIPVINVVVSVIMNVKLARAFRHGTGFAIGLILIPNLFTLILGFDQSTYLGPQ